MNNVEPGGAPVTINSVGPGAAGFLGPNQRPVPKLLHAARQVNVRKMMNLNRHAPQLDRCASLARGARIDQ